VQQTRKSRTALAILLIVVGAWGLATLDFVAIWAPGIQPSGLRPAMAIACALVSAGTGAGLLAGRHARLSARFLLGFLVLWTAWCKLPPLLHAPLILASWESLGETMVVAAAAWALAVDATDVSTGADASRRLQRPLLLYGCALIAFGAAHFGYPAMTAALVPGWLPWPLEWVYFTGAAYIAAGVVLVAGWLRLTAAFLSSLQMAMFGILVWLPKIAGGARDPGTINEAAISFALAVSGWVIASLVASVTGRTVEGQQHLFSRFVLVGKSRALR
jgi:uncharacterized membrane protein